MLPLLQLPKSILGLVGAYLEPIHTYIHTLSTHAMPCWLCMELSLYIYIICTRVIVCSVGFIFHYLLPGISPLLLPAAVHIWTQLTVWGLFRTCHKICY